MVLMLIVVAGGLLLVIALVSASRGRRNTKPRDWQGGDSASFPMSGDPHGHGHHGHHGHDAGHADAGGHGGDAGGGGHH